MKHTHTHEMKCGVQNRLTDFFQLKSENNKQINHSQTTQNQYETTTKRVRMCAGGEELNERRAIAFGPSKWRGERASEGEERREGGGTDRQTDRGSDMKSRKNKMK